jgi:type IV pilus assembly protein PilB
MIHKECEAVAVGAKLGELLIKEGLLKPAQFEKAVDATKKNGQRFGLAIVEMGFVREDQITKVLEKYYQLPSIDLTRWEVDPQITKLINRELCEKNCILPVMKQGNVLVVAFADPSNIFLRDDLGFLTRSKIQVVVSPESAISAAINRTYGDKMSNMTFQQKTSDKGEEEIHISGVVGSDIIAADGAAGEDAPIVKFVNMVMSEAIRRRASDIHFEPYEKKFRVRFRIDGNLVEAIEPPQGMTAAIVSRLKIMAQLDIAEKRKPQDGRIKVKTAKGTEIDFRVSTVPTMWGEKVVLRILDKNSLQLDMLKLGFEPEDLKLFKDNIFQPQGMVLITGPTGSGKTTTIYSALSDLNKPDVNICTAEDPIEFNFEGINQVQVNPDIDLTFASALKAFLRQDPDIIMLGEIRDLETGEIAFKAASTGHLVVSTLHTNDAAGTINRLVDMGIPPFLIVANVNLIVAQRLVGKNCDSCKIPMEVPIQVLVNLGIDPKDVDSYKLAKGKGCSFCNNTGIRGRLAIYELLPITESIKEAVLSGATTSQLRIMSRELGMRTLRRSALLKLKRGETTIEEVLSASMKDI